MDDPLVDPLDKPIYRTRKVTFETEKIIAMPYGTMTTTRSVGTIKTCRNIKAIFKDGIYNYSCAEEEGDEINIAANTPCKIVYTLGITPNTKTPAYGITMDKYPGKFILLKAELLNNPLLPEGAAARVAGAGTRGGRRKQKRHRRTLRKSRRNHRTK
jgi:hypothetical protein